MNKFGGLWTYKKIKIVEDYAKAYLEIMKIHPYWKLLYFDGFAGSGEIKIEGTMDTKILEGAARKIVGIKQPKMFDTCYFVELDKVKAQSLRESLYSIRKGGVFVVEDDCNRKLVDLAGYLKGKGKDHKVLAFIDPCGMEINWRSIEVLRGLPVDLWILIPTGMGANRILTKDSNIPEAWWLKLENFFGVGRDELSKEFYAQHINPSLFGSEVTIIQKRADALKRIQKIYHNRLNRVFKYVSIPFVLKNSKKSIMFDFVLASNNAIAVKIANDIIKKNY